MPSKTEYLLASSMIFTVVLLVMLNIFSITVVLAQEANIEDDSFIDKTEKPKLTPLKYFDFTVNVSSESVNVAQGNTASIPVQIELILGTPQEIKLSTSKHSDFDIFAWFSEPFIIPTSTTSLFIETSCNTPEGQYFISINGKSQEVLHYGNNMINFVVKPNPNCQFPPKDKNDPIALKNKASLFYNLDRLDEAIRNYDKVLTIEPNDPVSLKNKASILSELGMYNESIRLCDVVLDIEPNDPFALRNKADALYGLKDYDRALSYYNQVLDIKPNDLIALKNKASLYYDIKKYEIAFMLYDKILAIEPNNWVALNNKASALYEIGKFDESIQYYDRILKIDPDNWVALNNKANAFYELEKYEDAVTYYNKVLLIKPDEQRAITYKQLALDKIGAEKPELVGGCLIATATFGSELAPQVQFLREFRDNTVMSTSSGTLFMSGFNTLYYSFSPAIADLERQSSVFKEMVKITITPLLSSLSLLSYANIDSEAEMLGYGIGIIIFNIGMYFVVPVIIFFNRKNIFH